MAAAQSLMRGLWTDPDFVAILEKRRAGAAAAAQSGLGHSGPIRAEIPGNGKAAAASGNGAGLQADIKRRLAALAGPYKEAVAANVETVPQMKELFGLIKAATVERDFAKAANSLGSLEALLGRSGDGGKTPPPGVSLNGQHPIFAAATEIKAPQPERAVLYVGEDKPTKGIAGPGGPTPPQIGSVSFSVIDSLSADTIDTASVVIAGQSASGGIGAFMKVPAGKQAYSANAPAYKPQFGSVVVVAGQNTVLEIALTPTPKPVVGIKISPRLTMLDAGSQAHFTATRVYADKSEAPTKLVAWRSTDEKVVWIDKNTGEANAKVVPGGKHGGGTVEIWVKDTEFGVDDHIKLLTAQGKFLQTPTGPITFHADEEKIVKPLIIKASAAFLKAESLDKSMDKMSNDMGDVLKKIPEQISDITAEISKNTTSEAKQAAESTKDAMGLAETLKIMVNQIKTDLEEAKNNLVLNEKDLEAVKDEKLAAHFREVGNNLDKAMTLVLKTVGNIIGASVAVAGGKPWGAAKPAWDQMSELIKFYHTNSFLAKAAELEKKAAAIKFDNAVTRFQNAAKHLKKVGEHLPKAQKLAKDFDETYTRRRKESDAKYDQTTKGNFKFATLLHAIDFADNIVELAKVAHDAADSAAVQSFGLGKFNVWTPAKPDEAQQTIRDMYERSATMRQKAQTRSTVAEGIGKKLRNTYAKAAEAQAKAPVSAPAGAKK